MLNTNECKYHGFHACLSLWKNRPKDVIKVFVDKDSLPAFKALLKWCAQHKRGYNVVSKKDLEALTGSVHHEGICMIAKELSHPSLTDLIKEAKRRKKPMLVPFLSGVQNPHNIGAILRSAAHFDIPFLLSSTKEVTKISASTYRVAQGGAEWTGYVFVPDEMKALTQLKKEGFRLIGTSSHEGKSLYDFTYDRHTVLLMGGESHGLDPRHEALLEEYVQIPGTGHVESLNVSVATAVIMSSYYQSVR